MRSPIIQVRDLTRVYHSGSAEVHAVSSITLDLYPGEMTAVVGRSGSGKTTFLNLISGLDQPTSGEVIFDGEPLHSMGETQRLRLRQQKIGFVFQSFGLLPLLTAAENVGVPLRMRQLGAAERDARVTEALSWVGLLDRARHRPYELSGGEQQRVAIARALAVRPQVILADEPTGQLDSSTGRRILDLLRRLVGEAGITVVVVTHDPQTMDEADVIHELRDGELIDTRYKSARRSVAPLN
ncbi:MAG: ABC transporter ATP-binding protein [Anaerolinea sp.]|nr:ABC transporter ATP-binding protein [Anaerolinea sp.]